MVRAPPDLRPPRGWCVLAWPLCVPVGGGPPASRPRSVLLLGAPPVFWAPSGPAAREIATRELRSEWSISRPALALRTLRRPSHQWRLFAGGWFGAFSALALPPPTGTAARPSGPSGALHTGGACVAVRC